MTGTAPRVGKTFGGLPYLRPRRNAPRYTGSEPLTKATRREAVERLERVVDRQERKIAAAFREAVANIRDTLTIEEIARRLERGESVAVLLTDEGLRNQLRPVEAAIGNAVVEGGRVAADLQPTGVRGPGGAVNFTFNATNPRLSEFSRRVTSERIREISEDVRGVVREVVRRETVAGRNPIDQARTIRQSVGLTARQEQAVQNYRQLLEEGDRAALQRALRDRRFDSTVARAISGERRLSAQQIDRMVERYRERFVKYRSEVIGRTEALRSVNGANREYMQSFVDDGTIDERQVRRFWHTAQDERVRSSHRMIPAMNANGVGLNEPFQTPLGPLDYPGDPSGAAANTIQCFVPGTTVRGNVVAGSKTWYSGQVVEVQTRAGRRLTVTPNHPILTRTGFVPAGELDEAQDLVAYRVTQEDATGVGNQDTDQVPTFVEDVFTSLVKLGTSSFARVVREDFHGDGRGAQGEIHVVRANRILPVAVDATVQQSLAQLALEHADDTASARSPIKAALKRVLTASRRFVGSLNLGSTLSFGHARPLDALCFASASQVDAMSTQKPGESGPADIEFSGQGEDRFTSPVTFDPVVRVRHLDFSGHVYDLQTDVGLLVAEGIVTHNCRCMAFQRVVSLELIEEGA